MSEIWGEHSLVKERDFRYLAAAVKVIPFLQSGSYYLKVQIAGERREVSLQTANHKIATQRANRLVATVKRDGWQVGLAQLREGKEPVNRATPSIKDLCKMYDRYCAESDKAPNPTTAKRCKQELTRIANSIGVSLVGSLTAEKLAKFRESYLKTGGKTALASMFRYAKSVFKKGALAYYATRYNVDLANPFDKVELPKVQIEPYTPLAAELRQTIIKEAKDLPAVQRLIFLLAFNCGLRRNEIDKCRLRWFSVQKKNVLLTVQAESDFIPKSKSSRVIAITRTLHGEMLALRETLIEETTKRKETSEKHRAQSYLIPSKTRGGKGNIRTQKAINALCEWLKSRGVTDSKPLHQLRKEFGSIVATQHGLFVASRTLGHSSYDVTLSHYASLVQIPTIEIE